MTTIWIGGHRCRTAAASRPWNPAYQYQLKQPASDARSDLDRPVRVVNRNDIVPCLLELELDIHQNERLILDE
jgi:hypothetical protein